MSKFKVVAFLLIITLLISLSACGKAGGKIAEQSVEKAVEKATGGTVDLSNDGLKIEGDGQSIAIGDKLAWPKDVMGDLPEPRAQVTGIIKGEANNGAIVIVSEFGDVKGYVEQLQDMGYKDVMNIEDTEGFIYTGKKAVNETKSAVASITYNFSSKEGSITYSSEETE